ncbi:glycosyltransferase family 2 protein [Collinsella intestinalis]|uniref:glycosyltransferase family 2 protein n=1 Tax=Collinsella intestinalis TaxID=147207 RepID=UPI00195EE69E|nr:glycosyltransferase family 2 protein [Collinsella intestinalis]MBM6683391.1 glycosyltransferase family 2 protein [Collinsella intestinalis]
MVGSQKFPCHAMEDTLLRNDAYPKIAVAVSVYNGKDHLAEQLDSIFAQQNVSVTVYVRDDGSSDGSVELLQRYTQNGDMILLQGENRGVVGSFFELLSQIPDDYEYVALCDQDDVWFPEKLSRAIRVLQESGGKDPLPAVYCSEYIFCDEGLHQTGRSHLNCIGVGFYTTLYENKASGNTMVLNRELHKLLNNTDVSRVYCHDWWIALVASAVGKLVFDDYASLLYRRTGSNVSPTGMNGLSLLKFRMKTFLKSSELDKITEQLRCLSDSHGKQLSHEKQDTLNLFLSGSRLRKMLFPHRLRQAPIEEIALRVLFLLGKL